MHHDSCRTLPLPSLSLLFLLLLLLLSSPPSAHARMKCWSNNCADNSDWCIQTCSLDQLQRSCLAQFRETAFGGFVDSYFGCHDVPCDPTCEPQEGTASDFTCCCSGDLCNSIPGLTPDGTTTPSTNTDIVPTLNHTDGVVVCEVFECGENPNDCYYGYEECSTEEAAFCEARYKYVEELDQYRLTKKQCTIDTVCSGVPVCEVHNGEDHTEIKCCCDGDICNQNVTFTHPNRVDYTIDPCDDMDCHHSCIVHDGIAHCYCNYGTVLSDDKKTCIDFDECSLSNGNCEVDCINEIGTGYHCGCPDNQKLSEDGFLCEETGLICHSLSCNSTGIGCDAGYVNEYCDLASENSAVNADSSNHHCQATYKLREDGTFEPRFLSCFSGSFRCDHDSVCKLKLIPTTTPEGFYYCCCDENYCNGHETVDFPVVTDPTVATPTPNTTSSSTEPHTTEPNKTPTASTDPTSSDSKSRLVFIIVVIVALLLLIPVVAVGIGCLAYMYCIGRTKPPHAVVNMQDTVCLLDTPDLAFNNLSFIDKVGQGRFAAVWRAKNIEAEVAVKVFPNGQMSRESWTRECEIYKTPELEHKFILSFRGSVEKPTELWIVSDYYPLGSLHDLLKKQTLSLKQFCDLAESAAVGLAHLHDQRIVDGATKKPSIAHRDLKSKNILISNNYTCVISDFGLAIKFLNEETSSDAHGQVGTSRYMAPEVLEGAISFQREAYLRIDVYAFGLILWELASKTNLTNASVKQYRPPFDEYVSPNPSIEEMREVVVGQFKRPTIAIGFTTNADYDSLRDTIEESWDQEPEARLSAQCIAERIRTFKLSKFSSKESGLTDTNSPVELTGTSGSIDSQMAATIASLSSSRTMSPMTSKNCMLDSGNESISAYPGQALSSETVRLGAMSSNSSFAQCRNHGSANFNLPHNFGGSSTHFNHYQHHHPHPPSNRALYSLHSTETTV